MVCLPLAGALCRRFRVAWQSSKQLLDLMLQDDERYFYRVRFLSDAIPSRLGKLLLLLLFHLWSGAPRLRRYLFDVEAVHS